MDDRCDFIWQLIQESPALNRQLHELEDADTENQDKKISGLIDFYRDIDLGIECVLDACRHRADTQVRPLAMRMRS